MGSLLVGNGYKDLHIARTCGGCVNVAPRNHRARKSRLGPVEVELVSGVATGKGHGMRSSLGSAGEHPHALRHFDMHLGGETVSHVTRGREPARSVEKVGDGLLNRGQLQALDGAVLAARDDTLVFEGPVI